MEKREREIGSSRVAWRKREDSRNRLTSAEGEGRRWRIVGVTTVCIYFHSAAGKRQRREEDGKKRSEEDDAMPVRIYYWRIIGGKERRRAKRRGGGAKGRRKTGTSTRVVRGKKGRAK